MKNRVHHNRKNSAIVKVTIFIAFVALGIYVAAFMDAVNQDRAANIERSEVYRQDWSGGAKNVPNFVELP